jgi:hypothetical protein
VIKRRFVRYLLYLVIIVITITLYSEIYMRFLLGEDTAYYIPNFSIKFFVALVVDILLGMLFGVEHFIRNKKISGKWQFQFDKLIIIGIPLLILSISYFNFFFMNNVLHINAMMLLAPSRETFFRFLLGYTIITSFYKNDN